MFSRLEWWADDFGGEARGSSSGFRMPQGGVLMPDASWTSPETWVAHPRIDIDAHPFCPEFVVEIRSTSDNLAPLHAKMRLYLQNSAQLGWLIDPRRRQAYIYRAGRDEPERQNNPTILSDEDVLPGFTFEGSALAFRPGMTRMASDEHS